MNDIRILMNEKASSFTVACAFNPEIKQIKPEPKGIPIR